MQSASLHVQGPRTCTARIPQLVVPRLLVKTIRGSDGSRRTTARYWVELHGADFPFQLPEGLEWIEARIDGRIAGQVDFDQSRSLYRLRFPGDSGQRPVLVELEFQEAAPKSGRELAAARAAGRRGRAASSLGGSTALEHGSGWNSARAGRDENRWAWSGLSWKRSPGKESAGQNEWLVGAAVRHHRSTISPDRAATCRIAIFSAAAESQWRLGLDRSRNVAGRHLFGVHAGHRVPGDLSEASISDHLAWRSPCAVVLSADAGRADRHVSASSGGGAGRGALAVWGFDRAVDRACEPAAVSARARRAGGRSARRRIRR